MEITVKFVDYGQTVQNTSLKLSLHVSDAFRSYLNDSMQCFLLKYNALTVEYISRDFSGLEKNPGIKIGVKMTHRIPGSQDPGTETLLCTTSR